jgi:asparagine synthase (glutamine-hydrolysing)
MMVSKLARNHVTVTLSGEGGDELFFGYGSHQWARRLSNPWFNAVRPALAYTLDNFSSRYQRISRLLRIEDSPNLQSHILSQEQYYFSMKEINNLVKADFSHAAFLSNLENTEVHSVLAEKQTSHGKSVKVRVLSPMEQQALFDIQYYLPYDLLTKVDRSSMHYSLETRVPYLDHRVVEFAINLTPDLKFRNDISKFILKQILYKYVPEKLFNRPKQGFAIPLGKWLKKELRYLIDDYLNQETLIKTGIVNPEEVDKLLKSFFDGKDFLYNRIWLLIVLHKWFKDENIQMS